MINANKLIKSTTYETANFKAELNKPINKRDGYTPGQCPIFPLIFYRYIGLKKDRAEHESFLLSIKKELSTFGDKLLIVKDQFPIDMNDRVFKNIAVFWPNTDTIDTTYINSSVEKLCRSSLMSRFRDSMVNSTVENAFKGAIALYLRNEKYPSVTSLKNICSKLLYWAKRYLAVFYSNEVQYASSPNIVNPKVLYSGKIKKHEMYFLYFMSLAGCDVIYFNSLEDPFIQLNDERSKELRFNATFENMDWFKLEKKEVEAPKPSQSPQKDSVLSMAKVKKYQTSSSQKESHLKSIKDNLNRFIVNFKKSKDVFLDYLQPLNGRIGFKSSTPPVIPNYFVRFLGVKDDIDSFSNDLFKLDRSLKNKKDLYLRVENSLPLGDISKVRSSTDSVWREFSILDSNNKGLLVNKLIDAKVFDIYKDSIVATTAAAAMEEVLSVFIELNPSSPISKAKNFIIKLLHWNNEFGFRLFKKFQYTREDSSDVFGPTMVYFGDLKQHEALFLLFLNKMGVDVLHISPSKSDILASIDPKDSFSQIIELDSSSETLAFPAEEVYVREETTARMASNQINEMIFTDDAGMYKPWQFEGYNIRHVTLKSTYEELKILWNEPSKFRTGFKVDSKNVYIPNLFAKVSGVKANLDLYCEDIASLKAAPNTIYYDRVPFSKERFTEGELNSIFGVFNRDGSMDKSKLQSHHLYKLSHLRTTVQDDIFDKLQILVKMSMFHGNLSKKFLLKIIMTVLNLDSEIYRLIQTFDYPDKVPKIVIVDNDETIFNETDAIILAFCNLMCFDIVIFTPTGYNNIESSIPQKYYDTHKLSDIKLDFNMASIDSAGRKVNSIIKNIFNRKKR